MGYRQWHASGEGNCLQRPLKCLSINEDSAAEVRKSTTVEMALKSSTYSFRGDLRINGIFTHL